MATDPHKVFRDAVIETERILARQLEPRGPSCEKVISKLRDLTGLSIPLLWPMAATTRMAEQLSVC